MLLNDILVLSAEAALAAFLLLGFFHRRGKWGYGPLFASIGVMQYLQTVLASRLYIKLPIIGPVSPGSAVLFPTTLFVVLLVYLHSGVKRTRELILGLAAANIIVVAISYLAGLQAASPSAVRLVGAHEFYGQSIRIMLTGTTCLVIDAFLLAVLYEALSFRLFGSWVRIFLSVATVLCVDHVLFMVGGFSQLPNIVDWTSSGLVAKVCSAAFYTTGLWAYLRYCPNPPSEHHRGTSTRVFGILSYRQRYELLDQDYTELEAEKRTAQSELAATNESLRAEASQRIGTELTLKEREERLAVVSEQLIRAQETERRMIARELHDELGQLLTAAKIEVETEAATTQESRDRTLMILDLSLEQVRSISQRLLPTLLDDQGLDAALNSRVELLRASATTDIVFRGDLGRGRLPLRLEIVLYRVAQEALTNAIRHAEASHISVRLMRVDNIVTLTVIDDGVGFDVDKIRDSLSDGQSVGLRGMLERVEMVDGTISIDSTPGGGTRVQIDCPTAPLLAPSPE